MSERKNKQLRRQENYDISPDWEKKADIHQEVANFNKKRMFKSLLIIAAVILGFLILFFTSLLILWNTNWTYKI